MNSLRAILPVIAALAISSVTGLAQVSTGEVPANPPASPFGPRGTSPTTTPATPPPIPAAPKGPAAPAPIRNPDIPDPNLAVDGIDFGKQAKIPYEALIKIAQSDANQPKDAEIYTLRISSKIGSVKPDKIELYLNCQAGPEVLRVDANGFFSVPHNEPLLKENPELVSNQPKGSLNLEVKLSLPKPELPAVVDGRVRYKEVFDPILKLNASMKEMDPNFGKADQQQFAIEITTGVEGGVKLRRQFGSRTLQPDTAGQIWFVYDPVLYEENPEIMILPKDAPLTVRPVNAEQAATIRAR